MSERGVKTLSSFQKKTTIKSITIAGTKPSSLNNKLLISTGIPSLDNLLGGGLIVGSVLLLEEDAQCRYGKLILKYYIAEGIINKHDIFVSSAECKPESILQELPAVVSCEGNDSGSVVEGPDDDCGDGNVICSSTVSCCASSDHDDALRIAWRYKNLHLPGTEHKSQFGHHFDLSRTMPSTLLESVATTCFDPSVVHSPASTDSPLVAHCYSRLLHAVHSAIERGQYATTSADNQRNILRIGIHLLGSESWGDAGWTKEPSLNSSHTNSNISLCQLLYALRALIRTSYAACVITAPVHLFQAEHIARLEHLSDAVVRLESFINTPMETDSTFKAYNGLLHIIKLPHMNALTSADIDTADLAFKIRRKRFTIEKFHLPPSVEDNDQSTESTEDADELLSSSSTAEYCSGHSAVLDF